MSNGCKQGLHSLAWSPNDKYLLATSQMQVFIWTRDTKEVVQVFASDMDSPLPRPSKIQSVCELFWSRTCLTPF